MRLSFAVATPEVARSPIAWRGDFEQVLGRLTEIGYRGVELQTRDPGSIDRASLVGLINAAGMKATGISTGAMSTEDGLFLIHPDGSVRTEACRRLLAATEFAADCGTHVTIGSIRGFTTSAPDHRTAMSWFMSNLEVIVARADRLGVAVVIEPQSRASTNLYNTVASVAELLTEVGATTLALEADSYHMAMEERSVPAALIVAHRTGRLLHVQISDTNRLAPGWGHLNWADFFGTLRALGYDGWVCVEASQTPDSEAVARQGWRMANAVSDDRPQPVASSAPLPPEDRSSESAESC